MGPHKLLMFAAKIVTALTPLAPALALRAELDALIGVDREAIEFEDEKLSGRYLEGRGNAGKVQTNEKTLKDQVARLKKIRAEKGCASAEKNLKQASDRKSVV